LEEVVINRCKKEKRKKCDRQSIIWEELEKIGLRDELERLYDVDTALDSLLDTVLKIALGDKRAKLSSSEQLILDTSLVLTGEKNIKDLNSVAIYYAKLCLGFLKLFELAKVDGKEKVIINLDLQLAKIPEADKQAKYWLNVLQQLSPPGEQLIFDTEQKAINHIRKFFLQQTYDYKIIQVRTNVRKALYKAAKHAEIHIAKIVGAQIEGMLNNQEIVKLPSNQYGMLLSGTKKTFNSKQDLMNFFAKSVLSTEEGYKTVLAMLARTYNPSLSVEFTNPFSHNNKLSPSVKWALGAGITASIVGVGIFSTHKTAKTILPPPQYCCPLTATIIYEPTLVQPSGHTYERMDIERSIEMMGRTDPLTRTPIRRLVPNRALKDAIEQWLHDHPRWLLQNPDWLQDHPNWLRENPWFTRWARNHKVQQFITKVCPRRPF
jgi:hypothetical protein